MLGPRNASMAVMNLTVVSDCMELKCNCLDYEHLEPKTIGYRLRGEDVTLYFIFTYTLVWVVKPPKAAA